MKILPLCVEDKELAYQLAFSLHPDLEKEAMTLALELNCPRKNVNRVLFANPSVFEKIVQDGSARPLWRNRDATNMFVDDVLGGDPDAQASKNCVQCGRFILQDDSHSPTCPFWRWVPPLVPITVTGGNNQALPHWFGIKHDKEHDNDNYRQEHIIEFLITEFRTIEGTHSAQHVESFGPAYSEKRRRALIKHYQGINVPASKEVARRRESDIEFLRKLDLDKDLP